MNNWIYKTKQISHLEDLPNYNELYGFVYRITCIFNGKFYIGKKVFKFSRKKKIPKYIKKSTKTRKIYERVVKDSDWLDYYGSSKELADDIKAFGQGNFKREIIELCCSKKQLSYAELKWQIKEDVLTNYTYNGNILGRFYPKDLINNEKATQYKSR
jgi:hypothetical protein